jgi:hypothetical protein
VLLLADRAWTSAYQGQGQVGHVQDGIGDLVDRPHVGGHRVQGGDNGLFLGAPFLAFAQAHGLAAGRFDQRDAFAIGLGGDQNGSMVD